MSSATALLLLSLAATAPPSDPPLPAGAIARLGSPMWRNLADPWSSIQFTSDGKIVIIQTLHQVKAIDFETGEERWRTAYFSGDVAMASLPDDQLLVADYKSLRILDPATGHERRRVESSVAFHVNRPFTSDGRHVAIYSDSPNDATAVLDLKSGQKLFEFGGLRDPNGVCYPVAFVPGRSELMLRQSRNEGSQIVIIDTSTQKIIRGWKMPVPPAQASVRAPVLSPDGALLWIGSDKNVRLWEVTTGKEKSAWTGHTDLVINAVFFADGKRLLTASMDRTLRWWEVATGKELGKIANGKRGWVLAVSPDGRRAAAVCGGESALRRFDLQAGRELPLPEGHTNRVEQVAFLPDGSALLSASMDGTVRVWDLKTRREIRRWAPQHSSLNYLSVSADGKFAATAGYNDPTVRIWDVASGQELRSFRVPGIAVGGLAFAPKGAILAASASNVSNLKDKTVHLWDAATGREVRQLEGHRGGSGPLCFSPDGNRLATCMSSSGMGMDFDRSARIWDLQTGESRELDVCLNNAAVFSPDGRFVAMVRQNRGPIELVLIELASRQGRTFDFQSSIRHDLAFSLNGRLLVTPGAYPRNSPHGEPGVLVWDLASGKLVHRLDAGQNWTFAVSPDGKSLATGGADGTAFLWDLSNLRPVSVAERDDNALWADLAAEAGRAYAAITAVAAAGERGVALLRDRLKPAAVPDSKLVARLLDDLEDARFTIRQKAAAELGVLHSQVEDALRQRQKETKSAEARRAIGDLLAKLHGWLTIPDRLREVRAVAALERIGTPAARKLLEEWSAGDPAALLTREAKAALSRLGP
jgi:WD40 repeat protein